MNYSHQPHQLTEVAEVLEEAADLIETVGHNKGDYVAYSTYMGQVTGYCLMGALDAAVLNKVIKGHFTPTTSRRMYMEKVANFLNLPVSESDITRWNDNRERTPAEVIDALKGAAKDIRNEL